MPKKPPHSQDAPVLSRRALNRAYLARQHLLARTDLTPVRVIEHLIGLQSQAPFSAYFGLWSRIEGFTPDALSRLILSRKAVRIALMRGTIHLVSARDCLRLRPIVQPVLERSFQGNWAKRLKAVDREALSEAARALIEERPRTTQELGQELARRWPGHDAQTLANAARAWVPLVQVPPRGVWGRSGQTTVTSAEAWLGRRAVPPLSPATLFRRYLAAFGPATVQDAQVWCGLTGLAEVARRLRPGLLTFRDEAGRELFDLPGAPRPPEDTAAPVRLVAEFDNLLLSHQDRSRVIDEPQRKRLFTVNGIFPGTVLVDGFVHGTWALDQGRKHAAVRITPFLRISPRDRAAIRDEAERLLAFAAPDAARRTITFA